MPTPREPLIPGRSYHVYNQSVGKEKLFRNEGNYRYFLDLSKKYLVPYFDILSYCLMPNHFHLVIMVKEEEELIQYLEGKASGAIDYPLFLSRKFSHLFNSYAQAYNKVYHRRGSLFKNRFYRKRINDLDYMRTAIHYVHFNPVVSGLCVKPQDWKWSSFSAFLDMNKSSLVSREEVIRCFGDLENFLFVHGALPGMLPDEGAF
jgi:REP element-mobilizing transposase RayT